MNDATRQRMEALGLTFDLPSGPLTVILEDEIMHTPAFPVCDDPECICYTLEREKIIAESTPKQRKRSRSLRPKSEQEQKRDTAQINGSRPFRILR